MAQHTTGDTAAAIETQKRAIALMPFASLNVSFATALNTIDRLIDEKILEELDPRRKRNRIVVAPQIVDMLMAENATA